MLKIEKFKLVKKLRLLRNIFENNYIREKNLIIEIFHH